MFSHHESVVFEKNQIMSALCQLRFPRILSIEAKDPYEFQDEIRRLYPKYSVRTEQPGPKPVNRNGVIVMEKEDPVKNHTFSTVDGSVTVNLTRDFIAVTVNAYEDWDSFAGLLDVPVAAFCKVYEPACFERIGLRYINAFSKQELGLTSYAWDELLQPAYVGLMAEDDVSEQDFNRCTQDVELKAPGGCRVKLHTGPGMVKRGSVQENTPRFVLDIDAFMAGNIEPRHLTAGLQTVHINAERVFRNALTDTLYRAMEPME